jgi:PAS domain S-box-containing protein
MLENFSFRFGENADPFFHHLLKVYTPRQLCMFGEPPVIWLHAVSDLLIGLAYYSIPVALALLLRKRRDLAFGGMFWMFAGFILACGTTHFFSLAALWAPVYRLEGLVKLATALLSVLTAAALWRFLPQIMALPSPEQVLRANEVAWQGSLESAAVGIAHIALDGRWLRLSDTLCRITGYSREELQGTDFQAITHPEDLETGAALTAQLAAGEISAFSIEKRYLRKDGAITWVSLTFSLHRIRLPHEEPYFIAMMQDITMRKRAEEGRREAEALFRTLAEGIPSMAWVRRSDGSYEYLNPQWHTYTGWSAADLAEHGHEELIHPDELPKVKRLHQAAVASGSEYATEFRHRRQDGEWRWTDSRVAPVRDAEGKIRRWVGMLTDIHDQRQEREHLLDNERSARTEAEEASRLKDEFLAIVSHELRTPLSAIFGWSQLLLSPKIADTELQKGLETISRNARSQAQIIDDLLDMSRIITGKIRLDLQTVDLSQMLEKALDSVRPAAAVKGVRIEAMIKPSFPVKGDPDRLQQILWNLFSNAIRFTPQGGKMQVALERVSSHLEVSVSDTGEGIDPEFLPFVFDRFRQQDGSTSRTHGGLGLGLSIVRNLVELHGGEIRALSAGVGKGSTFILHLPISLADLAKAPERRESMETGLPFEEPSLEGLKILVVDDEPDTREVLRRLLESCAAQVLAAASAREALALLRQEKPHVLVSDIGMPHEDGYWLIEQVRSLAPEEGGAIPALALTALARAEDRLRALRAGFQAHTAKPVETVELIYVVAGLAGRTGRRPRKEHASGGGAR